ncbi:MAG: DNA polymerase III subunit alpha [Halanaerobiaceae bacterium]
MAANFVHLHNHTEYSLLDGATRTGKMVELAVEYGMPALALTDHGVLYGMMDFYHSCREAGIKPIIGCEVYVAPGDRRKKDSRERYHLVLLAQNREGYHNLIEIVTSSWLEGFYYKPRVDRELLYQHRSGIIALSGCLQGEIPRYLLDGRQEKAREVAEEYRQIFGDRFYLELQDHGLPAEKKVNPRLLSLARELDLPPVVTNDTHYLERGDSGLHEVLLAIQTGSTVEEEDRLTFSGEEFYFKSQQEMAGLFPEIDELYENSLQIAGACSLELDFSDYYLPDYPDTGENDPGELLREKCQQALAEKGLAESEEACERLDYELEIIMEMGYVSYFLIVWDFVHFARKQGIRVGPGRGSAAGSLVSYLLDITRINPLEYGLIFERFLNPERVTMPDIDIDFDERRDEIIEYVRDKYGRDRVAQIGTFGTMAARAAVRDVGRVLDVSYGKVDKIAKMISRRQTLDQALEENEDLAGMYEQDPEVEELIDYARGVEGLPRHISTHAAGVIIGPRPLEEIIPLQHQDESVITQLPMDDLEEMGLLKMDFLGLRNLTVINKTLELIAEDLNMDELPLDDSEVYRMLGTGQTLGVFQMESRLFQDLNRRLKPENFSDLIALLALGRPGPLGSGLVDDYIQVRHGEKEPEYLHPRLESILKETFGMILYQEQVMKIASEIGGFSLGEADLLRRGMGKKKEKLVKEERERFVAGACERGLEEDIAHEIFDQMEYFAGYGFNKSHSAAYALLAYQTAYLKVKYPAAFMSALLSTVMNNLDKVSKYIRECRDLGIEVLPPDVNESGYEFVPVAEDRIRFGLKAVKNVGGSAIESILAAREEEGEFASFSDFLHSVDLSRVNKAVVEALIKSGALDDIGPYRSQMLAKFEELYEKINAGSRNKKKGQKSFFDLVQDKEEFYSTGVEFPEIRELDFGRRLEQEREYLGIYLSGHPMDRYQKKLRLFSLTAAGDLKNLAGGEKVVVAGTLVALKEHITRRDNRMAFMSLEDREGEIDIVVFPDLYRELGFNPVEGEGLLIFGRKDEENIIADRIIPLEKDLLQIKLNPTHRMKIQKLKKILVEISGDNPVYFRIDNKKENHLVFPAKKYSVSLTHGLQEKLDLLLGSDCWQIQ